MSEVTKAVNAETEACAKLVEAEIEEHFNTKRMCGECHELHFQRSTMTRDRVREIVRKIRAREIV